MSVDKLQEKIRKLKCPIIVDMAVKAEHIPAFMREGKTEKEAMTEFCKELLAGLKGIVPGVRFQFDHWALLNALEELGQLLRLANQLGFYVLLDGPAVLTPWAADRAAQLLREESIWPCDGMVTDPYIGSDGMKPFLPYCKKGKSVFFAVRCPNKSASELQDLMTGTRLVHAAVAEQVDRLAQSYVGKCGYSAVAALTAATSPSTVMGLRNKHKRLFLLVDGLDYPGGNGKNCSYGFDKLGHGCAICVGPAITAAWTEAEADEKEYVSLAVQAAERIRNNMSRYITIL